jgi:hypothetical protein
MRLPSQWFLVVEAIDLRCGMDRLLVWVQRKRPPKPPTASPLTELSLSR